MSYFLTQSSLDIKKEIHGLQPNLEIQEGLQPSGLVGPGLKNSSGPSGSVPVFSPPSRLEPIPSGSFAWRGRATVSSRRPGLGADNQREKRAGSESQLQNRNAQGIDQLLLVSRGSHTLPWTNHEAKRMGQVTCKDWVPCPSLPPKGWGTKIGNFKGYNSESTGD